MTHAYMLKRVQKGTVYVAMYVDETLMLGNVDAINDAIAALKEIGQVLKIVEGLQDYLSREKILTEKKKTWIEQPHLIKNLAKSLGIMLKLFTVTKLQEGACDGK